MIYIHIHKLIINPTDRNSKRFLNFIKSFEKKEIYIKFNNLLYSNTNKELPSLIIYGIKYCGYDKCVKYINNLIEN